MTKEDRDVLENFVLKTVMDNKDFANKQIEIAHIAALLLINRELAEISSVIWGK